MVQLILNSGIYYYYSKPWSDSGRFQFGENFQYINFWKFLMANWEQYFPEFPKKEDNLLRYTWILENFFTEISISVIFFEIFRIFGWMVRISEILILVFSRSCPRKTDITQIAALNIVLHAFYHNDVGRWFWGNCERSDWSFIVRDFAVWTISWKRSQAVYYFLFSKVILQTTC